MTRRIEVSPAPAPLEEYVKQFDPVFGKSTQREGFRGYLFSCFLSVYCGKIGLPVGLSFLFYLLQVFFDKLIEVCGIIKRDCYF